MAYETFIDDDGNEFGSVEIFYRTETANAADGWIDDDGETFPAGWYWWSCFPGCLPDGDPSGPFPSEDAAREDANNF